MSQLYRGDVSPSNVWKMLKEGMSYLVDVRTSAEWHYVGTPDLNSLGRDIIKLEWRVLPNMIRNLDFAQKLQEIITDHNANIFFLCRTGGRSMEAAIEFTKYGYINCFNIIGGFEGDLDNSLHRGGISGWKAEKLPWRQD